MSKICKECHKKTARFGMFRTRGGVKEWIDVCVDCEKRISHENLLRARREGEQRKPTT